MVTGAFMADRSPMFDRADVSPSAQPVPEVALAAA
jgi:hypothetical protein